MATRVEGRTWNPRYFGIDVSIPKYRDVDPSDLGVAFEHLLAEADGPADVQIDERDRVVHQDGQQGVGLHGQAGDRGRDAMLLVDVPLVVVGEEGGRAEQMEDDAGVSPQDGQIGVLVFRLRSGDVGVVLGLEVVELEFEAAEALFAEGGRDPRGVLLGPGPADSPDVFAFGGEVQEGRGQKGHHLGDRIDLAGPAIAGQTPGKLGFLERIGDLGLAGDLEVLLSGPAEHVPGGLGQDVARKRQRLVRGGGEVPLHGHEPIARCTVANVHQLIRCVREQLDRCRQSPDVAPAAVLPRVVVVQQLLELHRLGQELAEQGTGQDRTRAVAA